MLYGRKLFDYDQAISKLKEIDNQLKLGEQTKRNLINEQGKLMDEIRLLKESTLDIDQKIELALKEQRLILLKKDIERNDEKDRYDTFTLLQNKMELEHMLSKLKMTIPKHIWREYNKKSELLSNPVVEVKHQMCMGCFIPLSKATLDKWRLGKQLVVCDICNRILA